MAWTRRLASSSTGSGALTRRIGLRGLWAAVAFSCVAFSAYILGKVYAGLTGPHVPLNDFFAIWAFAKYALINGARGIYDAPLLHGFMLGIDGSLRQKFPYPYPPSFLLMIWPIGLLPYSAAYLAWMATTLALYLFASFDAGRCRWPSLLVATAPAAMIDIYLGQTGFLSSALMVGGFRLAGSRPVLGGILFGLLSFKPQLGILLPIALVAARQWRTLAAASVTVLLLVAVGGVVFGWSAWMEWIAMLPAHSAYVEASVNSHYKPTVTAVLMLLGVDSGTAHVAQAVAALAVAAIVWACFRRGVGGLAVAALQAGTFLATPYAFFYDLPMLTNATLAAAKERSGPMGLAEAAILALSILFPIAMLLTWRLYPVSVLAIGLLFGLVAWRALRQPPVATPA